MDLINPEKSKILYQNEEIDECKILLNYSEPDKSKRIVENTEIETSREWFENKDSVTVTKEPLQNSQIDGNVRQIDNGDLNMNLKYDNNESDSIVKKLDEDEANREDVAVHMSEWGAGQWRLWALLWLPPMSAAMATLIWVFTAFPVRHRCLVPQCESTPPEFRAEFSQWAIPDGAGCRRRLWSGPGCSNDTFSKEVEGCGTLVWDRSVRERGLVEDLGMECGRAWQLSLLSPTYMLGMVLGASLFGWISDTRGRKLSLVLSLLTMGVSGCLVMAVPWSAIWHGAWRTATGAGAAGVLVATFVYLVEGTGGGWRLVAAMVLHLGWNAGELGVAGMAWALRDWRHLQLAAHIPPLLLIPLYFILPESPRWLLSQGKVEEARQIIFKTSEPLTSSSSLHHPIRIAPSSSLPRSLLPRLLTMCFQWFSTTLCYYGLHYSTSRLSGSLYANFCLLVLTEVTANLFSHLVALPHLHRRTYLTLCQLTCSLVLLSASLLPPTSALQIPLTLLGKFSATASFNSIYFYTTSLFPTSCRSRAVGLCSTMGRVGGGVALAAVHLEVFWPWLPLLVMAAPTTLAAMLARILPETQGKDLPETTEQAVELSHKGGC